MNKGKKIISTLAIASMLAGNVLPLASYAATEGLTSGIYEQADGSKFVGFRFDQANATKKLTLADVTEKVGTVTKLNNNDVTETTTEVKTGDVVTTSDSKTYTVVLYGDVDKSGLVDTQDALAIVNYVAELEGSELTGAALEAANVGDHDGKVEANDALTIANYMAEITDYVIDPMPESDPEQEVPTYALDEEKNNKNTDSEVKGISLENNVITVRVNLNGRTADQIYFYLKDLPEGATIEGTKSENGADATKKKVYVKGKEGTYEFTIKTDKGSVKVTVNVVDVTMPIFDSFKALNSEEVTSISDEKIQSNTDNVVKSATTNVGSKKFAGNVNLMKASEDGAKYYKVRIVLQNKYDNTKVIAVNQDTLKEYKTEPVTGAQGEIYVYLDANEAKTNLVLKHKDATNEQVKEAKATAVTFESTSSIWLQGVELSNNSVFTDDTSNITPQVNDVNNQVIDVGVDFKNLAPITFTVNAAGEVENAAENSNKGEKWIALLLKLTNKEEAAALSITNAVLTNDNDTEKFILDKKAAGSSKEAYRIVWIRAEKEGTVKFTLKYNLSDNKVEELPITVNLHDITAPLVTSVTSSTTGIINTKVDTTGKEITLDSYKYGMDATVARKETENSKTTTTGRWYSLELKTNVDVSSLVYAKDGKWAEIPEDMISNGKIVVWVNADKTEDLDPAEKTVIILANRYTVKVGDTVNGNKVEIKVKRTEKSKTMTAGEFYSDADYTIYNDAIETNIDSGRLYNTKIEEINVDENRTDSQSHKYGSIGYNLQASKTANTTMENKTEKGVTTSTIKTNSKNISEIKINGTPGKWILVQLAVRGNINTLKNETGKDNAVILDLDNRDKLLTATKGTSSKADLIPLWINLSAPEILAATKHGNEEKTVTPFKVTISSSDPVEETNSFYLVFEDKNTSEEALTDDNAKPNLFENNLLSKKDESGSITSDMQDFFKYDTTQPFCTNDTKAKALLENIERLQKAETTYNYVGDTVYINIKDDFTQYKDEDAESTMRIALNLNLETLGVKAKDAMCFYNDGNGKWYDTNADYDNGIYFTIQLNGTDYSELHANKEVAKEYIFAVGNKTTVLGSNDSASHSDDTDKCSRIQDGVKYIRYVITLTPTK